MYSKGYGVLQDYKEAARLYVLSAEQGFPEAQNNLGMMHKNGSGVTQNYKKAVRLLKLASEKGYGPAQYNFGNRYLHGEGVIQDIVYAHMWWKIAVSNGIDKGKKYKKYEEEMTLSQIEEAQRLARECVKKNYKGC